MAVSTVLHALPVALWLGFGAAWLATKPPPRAERLQIDILGMLDNRVLVERHAASPEKAPPAKKPPRQKEEKRRPEPKSTPKSVKVPRPEERPVAYTPPAEPVAPPNPGKDVEEQAARTISQEELNAALMQKYLSKVARIAQGNLVFPVEARAKSLSGVTRIAFTVEESGRVVPGSASVRKSSGHKVLDDAALNALRQSGQLPAPPKRTKVSIDLDFSKTLK